LISLPYKRLFTAKEQIAQSLLKKLSSWSSRLCGEFFKFVWQQKFHKKAQAFAWAF